jgi:hypothetical protein
MRALRRRYGRSTKPTGYRVLVFHGGATHPEVTARVTSGATAERLRDFYENQLDARGRPKRVVLKPVHY